MIGPFRRRRQAAVSGTTEAVPTRALAPGQQWIGHCGKRAQLRYLRQRFRAAIHHGDEHTLAALERLKESVANEPEPGISVLHLASVALDASRDCGTTWATAVNAMLDAYDHQAEEQSA